MSIKTKWVSGNKQQKLLAHVGFYLALLYNIYCLTSVTKTAKSHLFSALQNRRPVPLFIPTPKDAHRHTYTRTMSQNTASSRFHNNSECSKCQHAEERTGVQWQGTHPTTSPRKSLSAPAERLWFCGVLQGLQCFRDVRRLNSTSEKMQMLSGYFWPKPIYKNHSYLQVNGI